VIAEAELGRDHSGVGLKIQPLAIGGKQPSLPPAVARFGRYDVIGRVAVGGMAEIFLSRETLPGGALRRCALKVLKRGVVSAADERYFEELFWRECRTAVQLSHPNICHVYEVGKSAGRFFLAMEWIDGHSLSDVLAKLAEQEELMAPGMAVGIAAQVASALHYAHTARDARNRPLNVIHRDVNPQNIMLRHDGSVKLVDFGVAHISEAELDSRADTVKGKPAYMAPEQLLGNDVDGRVDVFALGVCLYEMLIGERLHKRGSIRETLAAVLRESPSALQDKRPALPAALDEVVQRALAKQPQDRFENAGEFQAALEAFLAERGEIGSAREVGRLMERLYPNAKNAAPQLDTRPEVVSYLTRSDVAELRIEGVHAPRLSFRVKAFVVLLIGAVAFGYALWPSSPRTKPGVSKASVGQGGLVEEQPPVERATRPALAEESPISAAPSAVGATKPPATPATATTTEAPPSADNRPKRRPRSPVFVADPGF